MKLNLGCGQNKKAGFVNVDKFPQGKPDLLLDLEVFPWPFQDSEVDEVLLNHTLEHLGKDVQTFFGIMKELYRVCQNGARIEINVPHPRHDTFLNDPTHVRIITPDLLDLFSKKSCLRWQETGAANSPLALYLDVDFEIESSSITVESEYLQRLNSGQLSRQELASMVTLYNNVATEYRIVMRPVK
jgi:predicted SAM-dependent methyltransferase